MKLDFLQDPDKLATFVTEYLRNEGRDDAGILAVTAADLWNPQYLPHSIAEYLLASPEIQAAIKVTRGLSKPMAQRLVSVETISQDMEVIFQRAVNDRQYTAAIAAKKLQGEAHGLLVKNVAVTHTHTTTTMSDADNTSSVFFTASNKLPHDLRDLRGSAAAIDGRVVRVVLVSQRALDAEFDVLHVRRGAENARGHLPPILPVADVHAGHSDPRRFNDASRAVADDEGGVLHRRYVKIVRSVKDFHN